MAINRDKPDQWKPDIIRSVDMYNRWFMNFAPKAFRQTRIKTTKQVETALRITGNLLKLSPRILKEHPDILPTLRMSACPPLAVDRLIGLAGVPNNLVKRIENEGQLPPRMNERKLHGELQKIIRIIKKMADPDIFIWLNQKKSPARVEVHRAATIIADRLCGAVANPIIRNAQERRQLNSIANWLKKHRYKRIPSHKGITFKTMPRGTFAFHMNVPVNLHGTADKINIPIDVVVMPKSAKKSKLPLLIEAKSAGDFTNVNKRRKEEAMKMAQLRETYGRMVSYNLFLCGYFDSGYLGYEAAEGIDWVWEHRIDDLKYLGL
jgi:hypothetical protein